jgi:hypothetical protein
MFYLCVGYLAMVISSGYTALDDNEQFDIVCSAVLTSLFEGHNSDYEEPQL